MSKHTAINLETGEVEFYTKTVERRVDLDDLMVELSSSKKMKIERLPKGCFQLIKDGDQQLFCMFAEPGIYDVGIQMSHEGRGYDFTSIPIPRPGRMILIPLIGDEVLLRNIRSVNTAAVRHTDIYEGVSAVSEWLPNTYRTLGAFCGGNAFDAMCNNGSDIDTRIDGILTFLQHSHYNHHLNDFGNWTPPECRESAYDPDVPGYKPDHAVWQQVPRMAGPDVRHAKHIYRLNRLGATWMATGGLDLVKETMVEWVQSAANSFWNTNTAHLIEDTWSTCFE